MPGLVNLLKGQVFRSPLRMAKQFSISYIFNFTREDKNTQEAKHFQHSIQKVSKD